MLPIKIENCKFVNRLDYAGFAWFLWIFFAKGVTITPRLENHEKIHYRQQAEMLFVFQWIWYALEYLVRLTIYRSHDKAYRNTSFEREAYANAGNLEYLKSRKHFAWIKHVGK